MAAGSRGHGRSAARVLAAVRAGGERARGARDARRASEGDRAAGGGVPARRGARRQPRVRADGCARATDTGNIFSSRLTYISIQWMKQNE